MRPILRFVTASGETDRILPGPIAGAGIWRGAAPKNLRERPDQPCSENWPFRLRRGKCQATEALEIAALVWARRPRKMFDIVLAASFGYFAEAENAVAWAWRRADAALSSIGAKSANATSIPSGLDEPRSDWSRGPAYLVLIDARDAAGESLARTIASLRAQPMKIQGARRRLRISARLTRTLDDPFSLASTRGKLLEGERFLLFLRAGDVLAPHALALVTEELARFPEAKLFYSDELIVEGGETAASFKTNWSPIFAAARPYLGRSVFLRATEFASGLVPLDAASFSAARGDRAEARPRRDRAFATVPAHAQARGKREIVRTRRSTVRTMREPPSVSILLPTRIARIF